MTGITGRPKSRELNSIGGFKADFGYLFGGKLKEIANHLGDFFEDSARIIILRAFYVFEL